MAYLTLANQIKTRYYAIELIGKDRFRDLWPRAVLGIDVFVCGTSKSARILLKHLKCLTQMTKLVFVLVVWVPFIDNYFFNILINFKGNPPGEDAEKGKYIFLVLFTALFKDLYC